VYVIVSVYYAVVSCFEFASIAVNKFVQKLRFQGNSEGPSFKIFLGGHAPRPP